MPSSLVNRNVVAAGKRTSIRLEPEFWAALQEIMVAEGASVGDVIDQAQDLSRGRTASVRVFVLQWFRARIAANQSEIAQGEGQSPKP